jgi:putative flippase GtrA
MIQTNENNGLDEHGNEISSDGLVARLIARVAKHFPAGQFGRYLIVGLCNTIFGYSTFALFTALLTPHIPYPYVVAIAFAYFFNVTFSFLAYKWFIFKTKDNYLREWSRCIVVYFGGVIVGTAFLPAIVFALRHYTSADASAPYIAGALLSGISVIASFLGHKNFSFSPVKR